MSENTSLENNKDSNSSDIDLTIEENSSCSSDDKEEVNRSIYLLLKDTAEEYCFECQKKNKCCWCIDKEDEWDNCLRRFQGYDYYCLECLEIDKRYYEEEIEETENKILKENDENKITEYKKWIEEYKERLKSTCEEIETARKYLKTGEFYEYHCINCDYVHYDKPLEIIHWICEVCNKQNYLFKPENFESEGYYYYDKNEEKKYTKNFDSLEKMNKKRCAKEHYYDQDDKYFYTDGMKFSHPHDPHNCLDCNIGFSRSNCPICNKKLRRRRYRDYLIDSLR